ncbi:u3 small nucleolar rna-associated protein [Moniliophthora roreri]|uniref:U3 small nucleolar RNA-associated protein 13 C-terminal domain-containing protein n=1 Tax=Moniliophthora roreri TaxID=221103 RepID=A0A0W0F1M3_MONRR|nr:u3 small nucleolar rna-associated protein [Moniliophthora roreri]
MAVPVKRPKLKTAFKNTGSISPLYTSGPVAVTPDGQRIITCVGEEVLLTGVSSGTPICRFSGDTESITSLAITPSSTHLLVFTSSLSLRIFEIPTSILHSDSRPQKINPIRVIARAHDAPVHVCKVDPTSTYLASGSADGVVKVWSISQGYITHAFKGHGGVVSALAFKYIQDPSSIGRQDSMQLFTASVDTKIRVFELIGEKRSSKPLTVLEGHVSVPRGLDVSKDGRWLVSGGRDSVVLVWDLSPMDQRGKESSGKKGKDKAVTPILAKTVPVLERVEAVALLHAEETSTSSASGADSLRFFTAGSNGIVKVWDAKQGTVLFTMGDEQPQVSSEEMEEQRQILHAMYLPRCSTIVTVHADQNILFHSLSRRSLSRQLIGFNDEIVDITFLSPNEKSHDSHIVLATNSSLIRVYDTLNMDARLLEGHKDIVLCLDHGAAGRMLASGSKDNSARLWAALDSKQEDNWGYHCIAVCEGHSESVGAIVLARKAVDDETSSVPFMFTGSQDRTIKMWDLSEVLIAGNDQVKCKSLSTLKAHDKDINSLDVAPNNRLLVSGSQDRLAKVWEIEYIRKGSSIIGSLKLLGTCKGHKRGVWTVKFGREEKVLATGSGDKTVKLWNLDDFSCVKTFEGHTNSVLRVDFLCAGMQLASSASDGLVKIWNIASEECAATLDNHEDKVWALAISKDERTILSGAADSVVTFWEDCTEEQEQEQEQKRTDMVQKEQDFQNYLSLHDYRKAIQLALAMAQPGRLLSLFKQVASSKEASESSITGTSAVDEVLRTLSGSDLTRLLGYTRDWNANAKTSTVAQNVLYAIFKLRPADDVVKAFVDQAGEEAFVSGVMNGPTASKGSTALKEWIDAFIPYSERHLARLDKLLQDSYMVDYILGEMDDGVFDGDDSMDIDQ